MRKDLIVGLLVSVLIHGGFLFGGNIFKGGVPKKEKVEQEKVIQMVLPPDPPDKDEDVHEIADAQRR